KSKKGRAVFAARPFIRLWNSDDDDLGADLHALIKVDDVLIAHPEAAGRNGLADRVRLVRAVNAIEAVAEIKRARAERIVGAACHVARQVGTALEHLFRRTPVRPFLLGGDRLGARPAEAVAA